MYGLHSTQHKNDMINTMEMSYQIFLVVHNGKKWCADATEQSLGANS